MEEAMYVKREKRKTAFDLLKILCMLYVVIRHATNFGLRNVEIAPDSSANVTVALLTGFSVVGVNCFVLITGFFLTDRDCLDSLKSLIRQYKRLIPLWFQTVFYSIGVYALVSIIKLGGGIRKRINKALSPNIQQSILVCNTIFFANITGSVHQCAYQNAGTKLLPDNAYDPNSSVFSDTNY